MEEIRSILFNKNSNYQQREPTGDGSEQNHENLDAFRLAEVLKTGYQTRRFSNSSTMDWLKTWRISKLV